MNVNSAFPSNYIKASDLNDQAVTVKIRDVKVEQIGRDKDTKPVLYFEGKTKGLVLNKTNAKKIAQLLESQDTDDWAGRKIVIYPTETEFSGETVECIRIKGVTSNGNGAAPTPAPAVPPQRQEITDEDVPF